MEKIKKLNNGEMKIISQSNNAKLYLYGDICTDEWDKWNDGDTTPTDISDFFNGINSFSAVDIYINSGGGSFYAGMAIYNLLKRHNGYKTVHIDGIAASIASVIACAGDKIIAPSNSTFMIHKPAVSGWLWLNAEEMRKQAYELDRNQQQLVDIYMTKVKEGVSAEKINELINAETWLTGANIQEYFDFEVSETTSQQVASISDYYKKYVNMPENLNISAKEENERLKLQLELYSM